MKTIGHDSGKRLDFKRAWGFFVPYWPQQAVVLVTMLVTSLVGMVPAIVTARIIDRAIPHRLLGELALCVAIMVAASLLNAVLGVFQSYLNTIVSEGVMRDVRTQLVAHLHRMPLAFFTSTKTGEIMNRATSDADRVGDVVSTVLVLVITNTITIASTIVLMFVWNWRLAILSILVLPFMLLPLRTVGDRMRRLQTTVREQRDELQSVAQETLSISGIALVKSCTREDVEKKRFHGLATLLMNTEVKMAMVGRWYVGAVSAMMIVGPAILWLGGGWYSMMADLRIGVIYAFVTFVQGRLYSSAAALANAQLQITTSIAIFERVFAYLDMVPEDYVPAAALAPATLRGEVIFENVTFCYEEHPGKPPVLDDVSFHVRPGQMAAFVGRSGAGKTTIANLVPRLYVPTRGRIFVDGYDNRDLTLTSLRGDIGIVSQETYLFHDTIRNNLLCANPGASEDALRDAVEAASLAELIDGLPDGYDTIVGERGLRLSGGERQRLAIARALLRDPKILILDEATSSLDSHNEAAIQAALARLMRGRTSLVIAHRLSTIQSADVIFLLEHGRIVESGTHPQLLERGGAYARLCESQFPDHARTGRKLPAPLVS